MVNKHVKQKDFYQKQREWKAQYEMNKQNEENKKSVSNILGEDYKSEVEGVTKRKMTEGTPEYQKLVDKAIQQSEEERIEEIRAIRRIRSGIDEEK